jgi:hypothetical protein
MIPDRSIIIIMISVGLAGRLLIRFFVVANQQLNKKVVAIKEERSHAEFKSAPTNTSSSKKRIILLNLGRLDDVLRIEPRCLNYANWTCALGWR